MTDARAQLDQALTACEGWLERRGAHPGRALRFQLDLARRLPELCAHPWIALTGRRGSGKSSLLNALAGAPLRFTDPIRDATQAPEPQRLELGGATYEFFDTPGLRAGGAGDRARAIASILAGAPPDALLFLHPAAEVDAGISAELQDLATILASLAPGLPLVALVTRCDELDPPDAPPPYEDPLKRRNIERAVSLLHRRLLERSLEPRALIPTVLAMEWDGPRPTLDLRWNLTALRSCLLGLPLRTRAPESRARAFCAALLDSLGAALAARVESQKVPTTAQNEALRLLDLVADPLGLRGAPPALRWRENLASLPGRWWVALKGPAARVGAHALELSTRLRSSDAPLPEGLCPPREGSALAALS